MSGGAEGRSAAGVLVALALCAAAFAGSERGRGDASGATPCRAGYVEREAAGEATRTVGCARGRPAERPVRGPARLLVGLPIELATASAATLEVLPNIGPSRAEAIVRERSLAPFRDLDDLARVHGIGPRTIEALRGWAVAGEAAPDRERGSTLPP